MRKRIVTLAAVLALAAACTGGGGEGRSPTASPTPEPWRGGTLRLALVSDLDADLDQQGAYDVYEWELFRCCLLRTLFSYNGLPASEGGAEARPDLAAGPPEISADGLTWTTRIKTGIHYAPPLEDIEITAQDFVRALIREASSTTDVGYASYYSIIEGFDAYASGDAETISGLETPDDHTLVVRLTEQAGDLPNRFALAATAPIPPNPYRPDAVLGAAEGHVHSTAACVEDGVWISCGYGHFLVASGPYMIEGSEDLDLSLPPMDQEPISGFSTPRYEKGEGWQPTAPGSLVLVRNPSWDPATDELRAAYVDRIDVQMRGEFDTAPVRTANAELAAAVEAGTADLVVDAAYTGAYTASQIRRYRADPAMEGRVVTQPSSRMVYISMNLAIRPFDDLHVRKAIAFAIDETVLVRHSRAVGVVATHLAPDATERDLLADYDPYPGSIERARQEMALSHYDRDGDGLCDAPECRGVLALAREDTIGSAAADDAAESLQAIGIDTQVKVVTSGVFYARMLSEQAKVPLGLGFAWASDYPNASGMLPSLFASPNIVGGYNSSLLGATRSQLRRWGYEVTAVPSADDRIDRCTAMTGQDQTECWAELDRYLMEDVVPSIPYMAGTATFVVSKRVAAYSYSLPTGELALDRIALVPGSE